MGIGMALAPAPGDETRERLEHRVRDLAQTPRRKMEKKVDEVAGAVEQKAGDIGSKVGRQAAEAAVEDVREDVLGSKKTA